MTLKTMSDIRADLTRAGYDDDLIKSVIRARIDNERTIRTNARRTQRLHAAPKSQTYVCPQARIDKQVIERPIQRGLIMVGEW